MFVNVQAAVGVAVDTDCTRLATMDSFKLTDTDRSTLLVIKFPNTMQISSTSFEDDNVCINISNHDGNVVEFDGSMINNSGQVKGIWP